MLQLGGTPCFVLSNQKTAHPKALYKGPHRHLALGLIPGLPARQEHVVLEMPFLHQQPLLLLRLWSPAPPLSTQLCLRQMPVLRLGSPWPENQVLKTDSL